MLYASFGQTFNVQEILYRDLEDWRTSFKQGEHKENDEGLCSIAIG